MASNRSKNGAGNSAPAPAPAGLEKVEVQNVQLDVPVPPAPPAPLNVAAEVAQNALVENGAKTPKVQKVDIAKVAVQDEGIKVKATSKGFYGNHRRKVGEVFTIRSEKYFSKYWMEKV